MIAVDVPRSWLRRSRKGLCYCGRKIPPDRFGRLVPFTELAGPAVDDQCAESPRRRFGWPVKRQVDPGAVARSNPAGVSLLAGALQTDTTRAMGPTRESPETCLLVLAKPMVACVGAHCILFRERARRGGAKPQGAGGAGRPVALGGTGVHKPQRFPSRG